MNLQAIIDAAISAGNKIYFTSDTHYGQDRAMRFSNRPFVTTQVMDGFMTSAVKRLLKKGDVLIHLGDLGINYPFAIFNNIGITQVFLLAKGHDDGITLPEYVYRIERGDKVLLDGHTYTLVHEPVGDSVASNGEFYLFGHVHKLCMVKRNGINIGVDCFNYKPATIDYIWFLRNGIHTGALDKNVFEDCSA